MKAVRVVSLVAVFVALMAGSATAQEGDAYSPPIQPPPDILGNPPGQGAATEPVAADLPATVIPASEKSDERAGAASLPLTGLQIALIVCGAGGLLLLGVAMQRASRGGDGGTPV